MAGGTGFEKMVTVIAQGLGAAENGIRDVAYGKVNGEGGIQFPGNKKKTNGLIPILREINKIDLCNIINYALKSISLTEGALGKKFTVIRKAALDLLNLLDGGLLVNPTVVKPEEIAILVGLLTKLEQDIDGDIIALYPKAQTYKNDINNLIGILIHYNAAVASYEVLKKATEESKANTPVATTPAATPAATTPGTTTTTTSITTTNGAPVTTTSTTTTPAIGPLTGPTGTEGINLFGPKGLYNGTDKVANYGTSLPSKANSTPTNTTSTTTTTTPTTTNTTPASGTPVSKQSAFDQSIADFRKKAASNSNILQGAKDTRIEKGVDKNGNPVYRIDGVNVSEQEYNKAKQDFINQSTQLFGQESMFADPAKSPISPQTSTSTTAVSNTTTGNQTTTTVSKYYEPTNVTVTVPSGEVFGKPTFTNVDVPISALAALQQAAARSRGGNLTTDLISQIASDEVQKVLDTIQDVKRVLKLIVSFTSVSDIASVLIPNEIKELQKIVSPTKLIPMIKVILNLAKGFNQIVQQILGYVGIAKTIVKVLQILIDVMRIAIWVFRVLPMPLMFATSGIMDGLVWARQLLDGILDNAQKILNQIGRLIDIVYEFCIVVSQIMEEIIQQIEILLFTLESCASVDSMNGYADEAALVRELKEVKSSLVSSRNQINNLTTSYRSALENTNKKSYNGYTMEIQEEEVFDQSIRYKRRRAVAFDSNGILVEGTDLTFATDRTILFEELRLKLVNSGYIQDTGAFVPGLDFIGDVLGTKSDLPKTTQDIYASIGISPMNGVDPQQVMKDEAAVVKKQINLVIDNIKGGAQLRKMSQTSVQESNVKLKKNIKNGTVDPTKNQQITAGINSASEPLIYKGETSNPDILSDTERERLLKIKKSVDNSPQSARLKLTQTYKVAVEKLVADEKARKEENK